jgi:predicted nucleic acid-binding Zn ribbon protein
MNDPKPKRDIARELFRSYKTQIKKPKRIIESEERINISDPQPLSSVFNEIITNRDWRQGIAEGNLFTDWEKVVGEDIAQHATPITLLEGKLTIQTSSTAWATQLRLISNDLLKTLRQSAPGALVEELVVIGPHAPSWKRGLRTIRGSKGPRDTYG